MHELWCCGVEDKTRFLRRTSTNANIPTPRLEIILNSSFACSTISNTATTHTHVTRSLERWFSWTFSVFNSLKRFEIDLDTNWTTYIMPSQNYSSRSDLFSFGVWGLRKVKLLYLINSSIKIKMNTTHALLVNMSFSRAIESQMSLHEFAVSTVHKMAYKSHSTHSWHPK